MICYRYGKGLVADVFLRKNNNRKKWFQIKSSVVLFKNKKGRFFVILFPGINTLTSLF